MPESTQSRRMCRDCDGFATVTITTGLPAVDGIRNTIRAHCPACRGLGYTVRADLVRTGR
ncbi:hypothetical protein [Streptomyces sp. NPDC058745]|uniref:hypothetical protein n=1 Tax=Streptomyces sp. NPDC058745 TaxID=3346621 RepID=UPI00369E7F24